MYNRQGEGKSMTSLGTVDLNNKVEDVIVLHVKCSFAWGLMALTCTRFHKKLTILT